MRHQDSHLPDPALHHPLPFMERVCVYLPTWISDSSGEDGPQILGWRVNAQSHPKERMWAGFFLHTGLELLWELPDYFVQICERKIGMCIIRG